jgi:hypothetical protein
MMPWSWPVDFFESTLGQTEALGAVRVQSVGAPLRGAALFRVACFFFFFLFLDNFVQYFITPAFFIIGCRRMSNGVTVGNSPQLSFQLPKSSMS